MVKIIYARRLDVEDLIEGIRNNKGHQIKDRNAIPLIDDLEIYNIFKGKDKEEGDGVMDLILIIVRLLKENINRLVRMV